MYCCTSFFACTRSIYLDSLPAVRVATKSPYQYGVVVKCTLRILALVRCCACTHSRRPMRTPGVNLTRAYFSALMSKSCALVAGAIRQLSLSSCHIGERVDIHQAFRSSDMTTATTSTREFTSLLFCPADPAAAATSQ